MVTITGMTEHYRKAFSEDQAKVLAEATVLIEADLVRREDFSKLTATVERLPKLLAKHYGFTEEELDFIINNHSDLGITKANTFLVDNRPANVIHRKNITNGIIVESFEGKPNKKDAHMFEKLQVICKSLLSSGKIPKKYMTRFYISGEKTPVASIGQTFDDGLTPVPKTNTRRKRKRGGMRKQTKTREKI